MADKKVTLPVLDGRRRLKMTAGVGRGGSLGDLPLSPTGDINYHITPRSPRFQTFDHSSLARLTSTHSSKQSFKSALRYMTDDPSDLRSGGYRSPAVQTKHEILLLLKDLRRGPDRPSIKHARALCQILETLSKERGYYSEEMILIVQEMNKVLFCPRDSIPERVLQYIYEKDVEVMLQEDNLVPYFYLTDFLYGLIEQLWAEESEKEKSAVVLTEKFEDRLAAKDREVEELLKRIDDLSNARKPMELELARVTEENAKLTETLHGYQLRLDRMEEKYRTVKVTLKDDMRLINDLESKVRMLNTTASDAAKALESLEGEHQSLLQSHMELRDEYKNSLVRLQQLGRRFEVVEEEKRKAEEEVYHLKVRAAASFEELTPRPSFAKVYEALSIDPPAVTHTEDHVAEVVKQLKAIQMKSTQSPRTRATRKLLAPGVEGRNRSPSMDAFAEEAEDTGSW